MTITHYDLFAGIGGFSLALEEVYPDAAIKHVFCEWEQFPTSVLRRHWPEGEFWGDIAELVTHTGRQGLPDGGRQTAAGRPESAGGFSIVTGGFPCQPFSHAGRRRGTADDRYQWPNMFAVIRNTSPEWVIAENVRGLVTWNDGMVLETVCADLESEGYEVQPLIIPAVAVGAPHRRDRVWIIGHNPRHAEHVGQHGAEDTQSAVQGNDGDPSRPNEPKQPTRPDSLRTENAKPSPDDNRQRSSDGLSKVQSADGEIPERDDHAEPGDTDRRVITDTRRQHGQPQRGGRLETEATKRSQSVKQHQFPDWSRNWQEVAFATCNDTVDDGLPRFVDGVPVSRARWRKDSLKAYGNGIVSQVAMEILRGIRTATSG